VKRGLLKAWQLVNSSVPRWVKDKRVYTGAALARYCAFSLALLLTIILALAGKVIDDTAADQQVASQLTAMFGPAAA
jgi:membrane protein